MATASAARPATPNFARAQEFTSRLMADFGAAMSILACGVGDRLGLFAALADRGAQTAEELSTITDCDRTLVRAWLQVLAASHYLDYDPAAQSFSLPLEHGILADRDASIGLAGGLQLLLGLAKPIDALIEAFKTRGGVPQSSYDADLRSGMERMSAPWFDSTLLDSWIPAVPGLKQKLERGIRVADIGCGRGRALVSMARRFPNSTFTGYDLFAPVIEEARQNASASGVDRRIRFEQRNIIHGLSGEFDLITMFNSLHDITRPVDALRAAGGALSSEGLCLILESALSDRLEENLHPFGAILYATGLFYNTPVSIANGGSGPGAAGLTESPLRKMCSEAGLNLSRVALPNPIHALYIAKP